MHADAAIRPRSRHLVVQSVAEPRAGPEAVRGRTGRQRAKVIFGKSTSNVFQTLWIGPRLSTLERLSLTSFVENGHRVHFYSYGPVEGIPTGVKQRDARAIVP